MKKLQISPYFVRGKTRQCIKYLFAPLYILVTFSTDGTCKSVKTSCRCLSGNPFLRKLKEPASRAAH